MRLTVIALATFCTAPAFAQEVRVPYAPPPEGFYRTINGVYDLLARSYSFNEIRRIEAPRLPQTLLEQYAVSRGALAAPLPPPCEPPPVASAPANKPAGPNPCPATR